MSYLSGATDASFRVEFVDWNAIEHALGFAGALRTSSERQDFATRLFSKAALSAGFDYFGTSHSEKNVWYTPEISWEATVSSIGGGDPPLLVTGLRPDVDLAGIGRHLAACGFKSHETDGVVLYYGATALACDNAYGEGLPLANFFAVDSKTHVVLASQSLSSINAALRDHASDSEDPSLAALLSSIPAPAALTATVGPVACAELARPAALVGRDAIPSLIARADELYPDGNPYLGLAVGFTITASEARAQLAFTYANASAAREDFGPRQAVLRTGKSAYTQESYSHLLPIVGAREDGRTTVFEIGQPPAGPIDVDNMFTNGDLGFARC